MTTPMILLLSAVLLLDACTKAPASRTTVNVTGDGNITNVGTGGSAAGSGDCGPNVNSGAGTNPSGNPSQTGTNTPNCSSTPVVTAPPGSEVIAQRTQGAVASPTGLSLADILEGK